MNVTHLQLRFHNGDAKSDDLNVNLHGGRRTPVSSCVMAHAYTHRHSHRHAHIHRRRRKKRKEREGD